MTSLNIRYINLDFSAFIVIIIILLNSALQSGYIEIQIKRKLRKWKLRAESRCGKSMLSHLAVAQ